MKLVYIILTICLLTSLAIALDYTASTLTLSQEKQNIITSYIKTNLGLKTTPIINITKYPKECYYNGEMPVVKLPDDEYVYPDVMNITCKIKVKQKGLISDYFLINTNEKGLKNCCDNQVDALLSARLNAQADYTINKTKGQIA